MQDPIDNHDLAWLGRLARALLGESQAADLVQDTVAATIERPIPAGVPRRAWLATVARRLAARRWRGEGRRRERERLTARPEALPDDTELVERAEAIEEVTAAARSLPEPFRRTILLRFMADLDPAEIAEREGRPVDTVRWRIRRGLELLRAEVGERSGDWRSASLLLLPLTPASAGPPLAATGASSTSLGSTVLGIATMKPLLAFFTALFCFGFWFLNHDDTPLVVLDIEDSTTETASPSQPRRAGRETPDTSSGSSGDESASASTETDSAASLPGSGGRVVDDAGRGVAGAIVFALDTGLDASGVSLTRIKTDARGYFALEGRAPVDLGVTANGFLRAFVRDFELSFVGDIVLERGASLVCRVVDPAGQPVRGLELMAHTPGTGITHVSPSQMKRRARRAALRGQGSRFERSRGLTDSEGIVELSGLPEGDVRVLCLDPSWTLEGPSRAAAGGPLVAWTARPRLGVRVKVTAPDEKTPVGRVAAVFRVDLELANGTTEKFEQWVGRGDGEVSFGLDRNLLPRLDEVEIRQVVFYGTISTSAQSKDWRAAPLPFDAKAPRIATVRVTLKPDDEAAPATPPSPETRETEEAAPPVEMTTLRLDVRFADGTPVTNRIAVRWPATKETPGGVARPEPDTPGIFLVKVPAGELDLTVKEFAASGSLAPWRKRVPCPAGLVTSRRVVLEQGGTVIVQRPSEFIGEWFLHASWRPLGEKEWRGSWGHGTDASSLKLSALRPAEWRFRVRQDRDGPATHVRRVVVEEGETRVVDP